jgi:hypothetical protein
MVEQNEDISLFEATKNVMSEAASGLGVPNIDLDDFSV